MSTIIITDKVGDAIRRLQRGWRINKVKRGRNSPRYLWIHDRDDRMPAVTQALVELLVKNKLAVAGRPDYTLRYVQFVKRVYTLTEKGENFVLPPEQYWITG